MILTGPDYQSQTDPIGLMLLSTTVLRKRARLLGSLEKSADPVKTHLALADLEYWLGRKEEPHLLRFPMQLSSAVHPANPHVRVRGQ